MLGSHVVFLDALGLEVVRLGLRLFSRRSGLPRFWIGLPWAGMNFQSPSRINCAPEGAVDDNARANRLCGRSVEQGRKDIEAVRAGVAR